MFRRLLVLLAVASFVLAAGAAFAFSDTSLPSGEVLVGGHVVNGGLKGGTVIEPAYNDQVAGSNLIYLSTPTGAPDPVKSNPIASAPIYLPVYPVGSTVPTLNCLDTTATTTENCPDHGPAVAGAAMGIMPAVYSGGVMGHDHLLAPPASGGDFNIAWVPTLVLFTPAGCPQGNPTCNVTHITTEAQIDSLKADGKVIEVALDGSNGTPNQTFTCAVVPASVYANGTPYNPPAP